MSSRAPASTQVLACVEQLEAMGFPRDQSVRAAVKWNGNTDQAANYILSGALDVPAASPVAAAPVASKPASVLKPAGSTAKERERAVNGFRAAAPPVMVSTPASRQQAANYQQSASYAAQQSPATRMSNVLQSPKRHLITPASPHSPYIGERPFSPSDGSSSSSNASPSPEPVARVVSGNRPLLNRPHSPYHPPAVPAAVVSPLSRSMSSLQSMQLADDPMQLSEGVHLKMTQPNARGKPLLQPSAYQSSLAALPSPHAAPPSTSAYTHLQINPSASSSAAVAHSRTPMSAGFAATPMAPSSSTPNPGLSAGLLSPAGVDPRLAASLQPFLSQHMPRPYSLSAESLQAHAEQLGTDALPLGDNCFIDVRDALGKWLEAQVLRHSWLDPSKPKTIPNYRIFVHYLLWDDRWDEWITPAQDPSRISSFRSWSEGSHSQHGAVVSPTHVAPAWVKKGDLVCAFFLPGDGPKKRYEGWYIGKIGKVDGLQMQVDLHPRMTPEYAATHRPEDAHKKVQRWFHANSDLIMPLARAVEMQKQQAQQPLLSPLEVSTPMSVGGLGRPAPASGRASTVAQSSPMELQQTLPAYPSPQPPAPTPSSPLLPLQSATVPQQRQSQGASSPYQTGTATQVTQSAGSLSSSDPAPTDPSEDPSTASGEWFVGQILEVKDSVGKFLPAEVLVVSNGGRRIFVTFVGWSSRWNEWLDTVKDAPRLRALGSALADTTEEQDKKAREAAFRKRIAEQHGFEVFDCDKDGNCLFRAVSHQIYGTVDRHAELRQRCYDYMVRDRDYFSTFIAEDFDSYIAKRRQDKQWGDHIEVVALREMFNRNLEVYNWDGDVLGCQPMGIDASAPASAASISHTGEKHSIPIIRLSFHGGNHYNSVVDPKYPPPLGDGADAMISMRQIRQQQEAKEKQQQRASATSTSNSTSSTSNRPVTPNKPVRSTSSGVNIVSPRRGQVHANPSNAPESKTPSRSNSSSSSGSHSPAPGRSGEMNSPRFARGLMRDTSLSQLSQRNQLMTKLQLQELWADFDLKKEGRMDERYVPKLMLKVAELLHHSQRATCTSNQQLEKLQKVYHEFQDAGDIDSLTQDVLTHVKRIPERKVGLEKPVVKIEFESFASYFFSTVYDKILWQLSR